MQLKLWLERRDMKPSEFAKKIGKTHSQDHKYLYEDVKPNLATMTEIYYVTDGSVTANDFYGLNDSLFYKKKEIISYK